MKCGFGKNWEPSGAKLKKMYMIYNLREEKGAYDWD
jgi:hypothetical protein